jgi:hypothetical protein
MSIISAGGAHRGSVRGFYPKTIEGSLRFNDDDSAYLSRAGKAGNSRTWTLSFWMKPSGVVTGQVIFGAGADGSNLTRIDYRADKRFQIFNSASGVANGSLVFDPYKFRDPSAWYHFVFVVNTPASETDRYQFYVNGERLTGISSTPGENTYPSASATTQVNTAVTHEIGRRIISNSEYFDGYMAEMFFIDGTAHNADAFGETKNGVWVPKNITATDFTMGTNGFYLNFQDDTEVEAFNTVLWRGDGATKQSITGMGFQPDLVWVKQRSSGNSHILFDAVRGFGNGKGLQSQNTAAEGTNDPSYGFVSSADADGFTVNEGTVGDDYVNTSGQTYVGWGWDAGANNAVTGHSSVTYTGNGGTQTISGLPFRPDLLWIKNRDSAQNHQLMNSVVGLPNNLESNTTDAEDTTNRVSSFTNDGFILAGNYSFTNTSGEKYVAWAWDAGDGDPVSNTDGSITSTVKASTTNGFSIVSYTGDDSASSTVGHGLGSAPSSWFVILKNRTTGSTDWPTFHSSISSGRLKLNTNDDDFGNYPITFNTDTITLPSVNDLAWSSSSNNYIAYCWHDVTGKQKFDSYTGTGASLDIPLGFRAGWVMIKRTDPGSTDNWYIFDSSRDPFGMTNSLYADAASSEGESSGRTVTVDSDSMTLGTNSAINALNATYIYAAFAGSYSDYITDYNTNGDVDTRVKANDTTGFSIVSYKCKDTTVKGDTIGHGLSSAPDFMIFKGRNNATGRNWGVYHKDIGNTGGVLLNSTGSTITSDEWWNNTSPTNSVVTLGNYSYVQENGYDYIAYCWAEKTGYSKFSSYSGSGSAPSALIETGFKPAFVLIKESDGIDGWGIYDGTRNTSNPRSFLLQAQDSSAESSATANFVDFESNGFKVCTGGSNGNFLNESGKTYIYAAFADTREAAFWLDQSGNDNDWQPVNLDHNDTVADSPTNNFCTMSPIAVRDNGTKATLSDGNLNVDLGAPITSVAHAYGTMAIPSSGQFFFEATFSDVSGGPRIGISVQRTTGNQSRYVYRSNGAKIVNTSESSYGDSFAAGDTIGVAVDVDGSTIEFFKNGTSQGPFSIDLSLSTGGSSNDYFPFVTNGSGASKSVVDFNFGQQPFKYDPPA